MVQDLYRKMKRHRKIHLLVESFNETMLSLLFCLLFICGMLQVLSCGTIIQQQRMESLPVMINLIFLALIVEAVLVIIIVFGFMGSFYKQSKQFLEQLKVQFALVELKTSKRDTKLFKTFLTSCQVLKIKFGMSNFIENKTPPTFQLFCIERIVDLLLFKQKV